MATISEYILSALPTLAFIENDYIGQQSVVATADFQNLLTNYLDMNYGSLEINPCITKRAIAPRTLADVIRRACTLMYRANAYKYDMLYETTLADFNPIENYSMVEEITTEYIGRENTTKTESGKIVSRETLSGEEVNELEKTGSDVTTHTLGSVKTTAVTESGTETDTLTKTGTETDNRTLNDGKTTDTHKVSPMDNGTTYVATEDIHEQNTAKSDNLTITHNTTDTNTKTFNQRGTDTTETNSGTDEDAITYNSKDTSTHSFNDRVNENVTSFNDRETTDSRSFENRKDKVTHTRSGNIGVTTSQQMLESSRQLAEFNFLSIVAHDVIKAIAVCVY